MKNKITLTTIIIIMCLMTFVYFKIYEQKSNFTNEEVQLYKCIDGDTASLTYKGKVKNYRFLAIDAPEKNTKNGMDSNSFVCNILKSAKKIEIEYDNIGYKQDKYNRELVWIKVDGELLQEKILEQGYAKIKYVYANYNYLNNLYKFQDIAIENKKGLWKNYKENKFNSYYIVTLNYNNERKEIKILENEILKDIENPSKIGCRFIGWFNGKYLFDLSTKIKKEYNLIANFDCEDKK